jgi:hypothetical protein
MNCNLCGQFIASVRDCVQLQFVIDPDTRYIFHPKCARGVILNYQEMILAIHYDSFLMEVE